MEGEIHRICKGKNALPWNNEYDKVKSWRKNAKIFPGFYVCVHIKMKKEVFFENVQKEQRNKNKTIITFLLQNRNFKLTNKIISPALFLQQ